MKTQLVEFNHKGKDLKFEFTPENPDFWISFKDGNIIFDIHYCEEYDEICVYEVVGEDTNYENLVYSKEILYDWKVIVETNYCGTDDEHILEDLTEKEAEKQAYQLAREHAESYSNIWEDEALGEDDEIDDDLYEEALENNSNYSLEKL